MPSAWRAWAIRTGPSRLISTAESSGLSKLTAAAEWMTMSQEAKTARSASLRPRPSVLTSPPTAVTRRSTIASNSAFPRSARRRSKALFLKISRRARSVASWRLEGRISRTSSQPGTARSRRSTRAVPTKPVLPVMAIRFPSRFWAIMTRTV